MPIEITRPRLSDTMEVGTILHWHVKVGDEVSAGDLLADIETDKATMELQSFDDGCVEQLIVSEGNQVEVGTIIATLSEEGEVVSDTKEVIEVPAITQEVPAVTQKVSNTPQAAPTPTPPTGEQRTGQRVSPVARRLAEEHGIDLNSVQGSGPSGRIIKRDILQRIDTTSETTSAAQTTKVVFNGCGS